MNECMNEGLIYSVLERGEMRQKCAFCIQCFVILEIIGWMINHAMHLESTVNNPLLYLTYLANS